MLLQVSFLVSDLWDVLHEDVVTKELVHLRKWVMGRDGGLVTAWFLQKVPASDILDKQDWDR